MSELENILNKLHTRTTYLSCSFVFSNLLRLCPKTKNAIYFSGANKDVCSVLIEHGILSELRLYHTNNAEANVYINPHREDALDIIKDLHTYYQLMGG